MSVKQERYDDAEIQALADKILEASKARMVAANKSHFQPTMSNSNAVSNDKRGKNSTANHKDNVKPIDEDSISGKFGWKQIGKNPIPYINRSGEKYCAVRMVEAKVLNKYLNYLHQDIYNCTCIRSYYITESEGRLLNEINFKHCDFQFGREHFTSCDLIVRLSDAIEFFNFLGACYTKLVSGGTDPTSRCGFIRINKESVVPYTVYNAQKYVPLFYFEGETENLKQRANKLEGWDLSYLKFCCKVQGIRNELFAHDSCSVISLNDIKNYFPPGTLFEDYWPKKNLDSQLLITGNSTNQSHIVHWTRQPAAPPVAEPLPPPPPLRTLPHVKAAMNNQIPNVHSYSMFGMGNQHPYHQPQPQPPQPQPRTSSSVVRSTYHTQPNPNRHLRANYYSNLAQQPPPIQNAPAQPTILYTNAQANITPNYMVLEPNMTQSNYHQGASEVHDFPPPVMDIHHLNGILPAIYDAPSQQQRYNLDTLTQAQCELQNNYTVANSQAPLINQQPAHQQSSRIQPPTTASIDDERSLSNGGQMSLDSLSCKLTPIPDTPTSGIHIPYKMQKALVEGKMIPCINMKPYVYAELLVTLPDLNMNFFNDVTVQSCQRVMKVLGIELYKPNNSQMQVLMKSGKCRDLNEIVPLVQVRNVIDFMPQLKYMLGGILPSLSNKRQRNS